MKWYIGQEIVCIKTHTQGVFKKGETYTIKGIIERCGCGVLLDIGFKATNYIGENVKCPDCGGIYLKSSIWYFKSTSFAPIDFDISELTDILEKPKELTNK